MHVLDENVLMNTRFCWQPYTFDTCVICTGAFDQHGCPLIVFPVDGQAKLSSELSKAEVVDFINYFLYLHKYVESLLCYVCVWEGVQDVLMVGSFCLDSKKQEKESLVSVVADLRHASLPTTRFIAETLLLLEVFWWQGELCAFADAGLEYVSNDCS